MFQRNPNPYPVSLPTLDPPVEVPPHGVFEHPTLLAGFELVEPDADTDADADPVVPDEAPADHEQAAPAEQTEPDPVVPVTEPAPPALAITEPAPPAPITEAPASAAATAPSLWPVPVVPAVPGGTVTTVPEA